MPPTSEPLSLYLNPNEDFLSRLAEWPLFEAGSAGSEARDGKGDSMSEPKTAMRRGVELYPYQTADVWWMCNRVEDQNEKGIILALDMGLGKTIEVINVLCETFDMWREDSNINRTNLIVCPNIGVMQHWANEIAKFSDGAEVLMYHGKNLSKDPRDYDIVITTYAQLRRQYTIYNDLMEGKNPAVFQALLRCFRFDRPAAFPLLRISYRTVILDEAHEIRNIKTASAKSCLALQKQFGLCLTGTPAQNSLKDFCSLLKFIGRPSDIDPHPMELRACMRLRFKTPIEGEEPLIKLPPIYEETHYISLSVDEQELHDFCHEYFSHKGMLCVYIRKRQAATHGHVLLRPLKAEMIESEDVHGDGSTLKGKIDKAVLDEMSDDMALPIGTSGRAQEEDAKHSTSATEPPKRKPRTRKNDWIEDEGLDASKLPQAIRHLSRLFTKDYESSKMSKTLEILLRALENKYEKAIVFSNFVTQLKVLEGLLSGRGIKAELCMSSPSLRTKDFCADTGDITDIGAMNGSQREDALARIRNDNDCRVILVSVKAGGVGLNITSCNHVVIMDPWWNPFVEEQAICRAHRIGQKRPVYVHRLVAQNTVESYIIETQNRKKEEIMPLLEQCAIRNFVRSKARSSAMSGR